MTEKDKGRTDMQTIGQWERNDTGVNGYCPGAESQTRVRNKGMVV